MKTKMRTKEIFQRIIMVSFCIFMCSLFLKITVNAQTKVISLGGGIKASLSETGTLTISGSGEMPDQTGNSSKADHPFYDISDDIYSVVIGDGITRIGNYSFAGLKNLQNVTIGKGATEIGEYAFVGCSAPMFTSISIPSNVQNIEKSAFCDCTCISNLSLNKGLKKIGEDAFFYCSNLKRINIPEGVNLIEEFAFAYCAKDMVISIPKDITTIKANAFSAKFFGKHNPYNYIADGYRTGTTISVTVYSEDVLLGNDCFESGDTKIKCYRGSTAEKYAEQYNTYATAKYLGIKSKLYFNANGGICKKDSMSVTSEYCYGNLPVPARTGYTFQGWFTKKKGGTQIKKGGLITQTSNKTVYAHWKKINVKTAGIQSLTNKSAKKIVVKIKPVSNASGYEVQYSTKKSMINAKTKKKKSTKITLTSLKKKKTYYVRTRAYITDTNGTRFYGKWSSVKKIKVRI